MLGRQEMNCVPSHVNKETEELYKRDLYADMKSAIDYLEEFNNKLKKLHPDIFYKIRNLI